MERVPSRCVSVICKHIDDESERLITFVREETGFFNHYSVSREVNGRLSGIVSELTKRDGLIESIVSSEVENTVKLYKQFEKLVYRSPLLNDSASLERYVAVNFATLPDGKDLEEIFRLGKVSTLLLFFPLVAPIGIGLGITKAVQLKINFVVSMINGVRKASDKIKMGMKQLEPELRRSIADIPMT